MAPRYSLAQRKARELLRKARVRSAPVPVERLARLAGAVIHYEPFPGSVSGMVHYQPDGTAVIGVNSLHPATRQRFTIAHELAHIILHRNENLHVDEKSAIDFRDEESSLATKDSEIEANQFAAELLMPARFVEDAVEDLPDLEDAIPELASQFEVSQQAMTLRLNRLRYLASL